MTVNMWSEMLLAVAFGLLIFIAEIAERRKTRHEKKLRDDMQAYLDKCERMKTRM